MGVPKKRTSRQKRDQRRARKQHELSRGHPERGVSEVPAVGYEVIQVVLHGRVDGVLVKHHLVAAAGADEDDIRLGVKLVARERHGVVALTQFQP